MNVNNKNIGIAGYWFATNYGGVASYYSLYRKIESLGYAPFLIETPYLESDKEGLDTFPRKFFRDMDVRISKCFQNSELDKLNELADTFILGSDQVLTSSSIRAFGKLFLMEFAQQGKNCVAFSSSCGGDNLNVDEKIIQYAKNQLKKFNAVSVREYTAVDIVKNKFGRETEVVIDPIFMTSAEEYRSIAEQADIQEKQEAFILAYILDPTEDKKKGLKTIQDTLNLRKKIALDGRKFTHEKNEKIMGIPEDTLPELDFMQWLYYFSRASFVYTDSFHGAAMAIILNKPFIMYANHMRGYPRFATLAKMFGVASRMIQKADDIDIEELKGQINFEKINKMIQKENLKAEEWLRCALIPKENLKAFQIQQSTERKFVPDFERCRMVVSLLKQYGIRHVVLSSGTRNLNLVRFFEANEWFQTYRVIDERSAGFFALGLALELKTTVALCCTSGTAASNYLTAVTEAFYQQVPLAVITADRYPCYLGQMEDQTIPQYNIYGDVCKKSVTLPVNTGYLADWETRRMICDALLEINHHGSGPVQINVPIQTIDRLPPDKKTLWLWNYRKISRVDCADDSQVWKSYIERLENAKRILLVYGQNHPLSEDEKKIVEEFADKYKCVIVIDHLSNYQGKYTVLSFPILKDMSQQEFNEKLAPEIVITVGGKRMLNDPIVYKLRGMKADYEHWRVSEDGNVADMFRRLTTVFECSQQYFFQFFCKNSRKISEDITYINRWREEENRKLFANHMENYSMKYVLERFMQEIPANSLLHISIGNTVMYSNIYPLKDSVEVYCNMGTNGIDGCASTFMGHAAVTDKKAFLIIGDLSFFYDMNSVFNKELKSNIRILLNNNDGAGLLRDLGSPAITHEHHTVAKDYVVSLGFQYLSARNQEEYEKNLSVFVSDGTGLPIFFEVFS